MLSDVLIEEIRLYLRNVLNVNPDKYLCRDPRFTCFNDLCIIYCSSSEHRVPNNSLIYSGEWVGVLIGGKPYVSTVVYEDVFRNGIFRASIVVSDMGCKAFLYGKDILEESVVSTYPPLNNPVAVIDSSDNTVIGVAESYGGFYRNVYDLGLFIRVLK